MPKPTKKNPNQQGTTKKQHPPTQLSLDQFPAPARVAVREYLNALRAFHRLSLAEKKLHFRLNHSFQAKLSSFKQTDGSTVRVAVAEAKQRAIHEEECNMRIKLIVEDGTIATALQLKLGGEAKVAIFSHFADESEKIRLALEPPPGFQMGPPNPAVAPIAEVSETRTIAVSFAIPLEKAVTALLKIHAQIETEAQTATKAWQDQAERSLIAPHVAAPPEAAEAAIPSSSGPASGPPTELQVMQRRIAELEKKILKNKT
jgi:hypothetical protein